MSNEQFHMIQAPLDGRRLVELGKMLHLPLHSVDTNYLVHCALGELFGDHSPKPYYVDDRGLRSGEELDERGIRVVAYSAKDAEYLEQHAQLYTTNPSVYNIVPDWDDCVSKPMPEGFPEGMTLRFEARTCPVVRKSSSGPRWDEGQELDAFLAEAWKPENEDVELEREEIYRDWLQGHFERRGGLEPKSIGMERFSIERMARRQHGGDRNVRIIQRPDVTLTGKAEVTDSQALVELLRDGFGRHKAFGFGMLKVRPA